MDENKTITASSEQRNNLVIQLDKYHTSSTVAEDEDPLVYWKSNKNRFPEHSLLACQYLQTPASSAQVEQLFLIAGKIFRPERCKLSNELLQKIMLMKMLLNNVIITVFNTK